MAPQQLKTPEFGKEIKIEGIELVGTAPLTTKSLAVLVDRNLHANAESLIEKWLSHICRTTCYEPCLLIETTSDLAPEAIRAALIEKHEKLLADRKHGIAGIMIIGKDVPGFVVGCEPMIWLQWNYSEELSIPLCCSDTPYGNLSRHDEDMFWADYDEDGILGASCIRDGFQDMPKNFRLDAWVSRWAGIHIEDEDEGELLKRYVEKRVHERIYDVSIGTVLSHIGTWDAELKRWKAVANKAFDVVRGEGLVSSLKAHLTDRSGAFSVASDALFMFAHGYPNAIGDLDSTALSTLSKKEAGPKAIFSWSCRGGEWKQGDMLLRDHVLLNAINNSCSGTLCALGHITVARAHPFDRQNPFPLHLEATPYVGEALRAWVNGFGLHTGPENFLFSALAFSLFGDGTVSIGRCAEKYARVAESRPTPVMNLEILTPESVSYITTTLPMRPVGRRPEIHKSLAKLWEFVNTNKYDQGLSVASNIETTLLAELTKFQAALLYSAKGAIYYRRGEYGAAVEDLRIAGQFVKSVGTLDYLTWSEHASSNIEKAREALEKLLAIDPLYKHGKYWICLADMLDQAGKKSRASEARKRGKQLSFSFDEFSKALKVIECARKK